MKNKILVAFACILVLATGLGGCSSGSASDEKLPVSVLILPAFEIGEMSGDEPGEAQCYYEEYLMDSDVYEIPGADGTMELYYKDGIALALIGEGKVVSALNVKSILADERFDFSESFILETGCAGSAKGYGIMGDVFVITACADYDLGHQADPREMSEESETTWFHNESFDEGACVTLNRELTDKVYELTKDVPLKTTKNTVKYLQKEFSDEAWANRDPKVLKGTAVTGDNYWKGEYDHQNALLITETYECPDPYAVTDMEDVAVALAVDSCGMLDRLIILRDSVNMDVFPPGMTPEELWADNSDEELSSDDGEESLDIFGTGMENNFRVGKVVIEAIRSGGL